MNSGVHFDDFLQVFEDMIGDLLADPSMGPDMPATLKRVEEILRYNVPPKVKYGGFLVPKAFAEICGDAGTQEQIHLSYKLGWCYKMIQCFLTMIDDYMDDDSHRYGRLNWYYANDKKRIVINDTLLLEHATRWFLRKYFGHLSAHTALVEYCDKIIFEFLLGQSLGHNLTTREDPEMAGFTMSNYETCARYTNLIFFAGAPHLAMSLSGIGMGDPCWIKVEGICVKLALFWTVRDDLIDSFGVNLIHEIDDKDIKLGKCSWLVVKAKELCSAEQWASLKDNYGRDEIECVAVVKGIYRDLNIPDLCKAYLKTLQERITEDSEKLIADGFTIGTVILQTLQLFSNIDE